jgi:hypothetical protein
VNAPIGDGEMILRKAIALPFLAAALIFGWPWSFRIAWRLTNGEVGFYV